MSTLPKGFAIGASVALAAAGLSAPAGAQDQRLQAIQREIQEMRRQYDTRLEEMRRDYETRLQEMERRLKAAESAAATAETPRAAQAAPPAPTAVGLPSPGGAAAPAAANAFN